MSATYNPLKGSVAWRAIEFLTTNPDEGLTVDDISVKFDTPARGVHSMLGQAVATGVLKREEDLKAGEMHYRLGKGHPDIKPSAATSPSLGTASSAAVAKPARMPLRQRKPSFDVSKNEVRKGIPLPPVSLPGVTDWTQLLARLEPGDSAELPRDRQKALASKIGVYAKDHEGVEFAIRRISQDTIGVWRVK